MRERIGWVAVGVSIHLAVLACGPLSAPESFRDIVGTADEDLFYENFESMGLIDATTGAPGALGSEGEIQFNSDDELKITFESKTDVSIRACLQERKGGGKILFNETKNFHLGEGSFSLGTYSKGGYVIRVILDDVLVKNLPFQIE